MKRIYFCVALVAGIWTVSVGDLNPMPVGDKTRAIALAKAAAQDMWRNVHVPTSVQIKDATGRWHDEASFGDV